MLYWPSLEKFFHALIAHFLYLFLEKYLLKSFAPFKTEIVIGFFCFFFRLLQVLVAACRTFIAMSGIFNCSTWAFSCNTEYLGP